LCLHAADPAPWIHPALSSGESPYCDQNLLKDKTVIVYCAAGGRAALSGQALKDMGYGEVYNMGGFTDWAESGGAVDR
jgi:rhodanese-related sulfurtransferase